MKVKKLNSSDFRTRESERVWLNWIEDSKLQLPHVLCHFSNLIFKIQNWIGLTTFKHRWHHLKTIPDERGSKVRLFYSIRWLGVAHIKCQLFINFLNNFIWLEPFEHNFISLMQDIRFLISIRTFLQPDLSKGIVL